MKVNENTSVAMPIKNMIGIIVAVASGIFAYTELTARLTSLETSRELFQADLLKKFLMILEDQVDELACHILLQGLHIVLCLFRYFLLQDHQ